MLRLLALALPLSLSLTRVAQAQQPAPLRFFFGNLHAHTAYSDGNKDSTSTGANTPRESFAFAKASQHFDFLGISEHNHSMAGMRLRYWPLLRQQADSATVDGQFVALAGMEWGVISGGGHVLIYGCDDLLGWEAGNYNAYVAQNNYADLWKALNRRPGSFASLAHPSSDDFGNLLGTAFSAVADSAIVGSPFRSGPAFSTNLNYSDRANGSYESYFRNALAKGYHVAPSYDHDNHNTTFGRTTDGRVVVLAETLTKHDILWALRARRFYASDDWNTEVSFTLNQQWPMGTIQQDLPAPSLSVTVSDADGELPSSIVLMRGTPGSGVQPASVATATAGNTALTFTDNTLPLSATAYYYAVIVQPDGDKIISAPVWYTRGNATGLPATAAEPLAVTVWPNPATRTDTRITVSFAAPANGEPVRVSLRDALGRTVLEQLVTGAPDAALPVAGLVPGIYTVQVMAGQAATVRRLVVE